TSSPLVPMMLDRRASAVAASSADRSVVVPSAIIVRVNLTTSSRLTPSAPAASATAAISLCVAGSSRARPRNDASRAFICCGVPSTVFVTPAQALSQSIAALVARPIPAIAAAPNVANAWPVLTMASRCFCACRSSRASSRAVFFAASSVPFRPSSAADVPLPSNMERIAMIRSRVATSRLLVPHQHDVHALAVLRPHRLLGRLTQLAAPAAAWRGHVGVAMAALGLVPVLRPGTARPARLPLADVPPDRLVPVLIRPGQEDRMRDAVLGTDGQFQAQGSIRAQPFGSVSSGVRALIRIAVLH